MVAVAFLLTEHCALAVLGEPADAPAQGQTPAVRLSPAVGYTVRETRSDAVTLREYISPKGIVFAIAW
ncbi:MAG: DUF2844 domain-containing protein, partial [Syntrophales bacterium LBB04]|nr:DUF2844 domain-containing protein [Syntrophales bacterium LBB04]